MRCYKRLIKKLISLAVAVIVLVGAMPLMGLEGAFKFNPVTVEAAQVNPFDTSELTVQCSGKLSGIAWTVYSNSLLWLEDDTSGETHYGDDSQINGEYFNITYLTKDNDFTINKDLIQYVYCNITAPQRTENMFSNMLGLLQIEFGEVFESTSSNITNMKSMFYNCNLATSLDVSNFDTSNVTDMSNIFGACRSLTSIDVSNFNTSKVIDMYGMFDNCVSLKALDVSNFDTSNVLRMSFMFYSCNALTSLNLSGFDTSNVLYMNAMFNGCWELTSLDVSSFRTDNVTDMSYMFARCKALTSLDVSNFNTSNVTKIYLMFTGCSSLTSLDLSNFNTSGCTNMSNMFQECSSLTELDLSNFDMSNVTNVTNMLSGLTKLHMLKTPTGNIKTYHLDGNWYVLNSNGSIDKTTNYNTVPVGITTSLTLVKDTYKSDGNGRGVCEECKDSFLYGDTNMDEEVNISDAVLLKKHLASIDDLDINLLAADVDVSNSVTIADAVRLMKKLAGMDVILGVSEESAD
ncbi:MAG: BspA family leucine-rich repeat surface protein [Lachnospira sp.]|nr:BspA family leucine-rich repeat surface protein [Lachnospira sp.]